MMLAMNHKIGDMAQTNTQTKNEEEEKLLLDKILKEAFEYMLFLLKMK